VDGPATLIAIWGGDSFELDHTAVPDNGFTVIDSYLNFGNNGETGVQVAISRMVACQSMRVPTPSGVRHMYLAKNLHDPHWVAAS